MQFQLADLYECLCDTDPEAPVLIAGVKEFSRMALDQRANRLAHHLLAQGIGRGDHVGVYAYNRSEWVEALLACWKIGAAAININFRYVTSELRYIWDNADMKALIYEDRFADHVTELAGDFPDLTHYIHLETEDPSDATGPGEAYEDALDRESPDRGFATRSEDDIYIVYTGGTTGMPKGAMWRHVDLYNNIARPLAGELEDPEDVARMSDNPLGMRTLTLSPLMHGGGQWPFLLTIINGGVGLLPVALKFDPEEVLGMVDRHQVTTVSLIGDAMARPIAEARKAEPDRWDTRSLKAISTGGALLTDPVRRALREAFGRIYVTGGIGSTEMGTAARETSAYDKDQGPRFALDQRVAVLDEEMKRIEPGNGGIGRLARCGDIPLGYYNEPEKTAEVFVTDPDGVRWVLPGDWARVEDDGTITLLGRGSQCINSGGEKIFPDEIEGVLVQHPKVRHAAVVGVPDPDWMERVVALVELLDPDEPVSLEEIQAHCRARLAGYKTPRQLILGPIERTPTGKIDTVRVVARARQTASPERGLNPTVD